jgi:hypothetical protein
MGVTTRAEFPCRRMKAAASVGTSSAFGCVAGMTILSSIVLYSS